jgi:23S rRNA (cytidine1920-2'-O)/16S rRNA (cytidine1409-2'-O)-methyltransferase
VKGIVKDAELRDRAVDEIVALIKTKGWRIAGVIASPIAGGDGNVEFLVGAVHS